MSLEITGLDEFQQQLDDLASNVGKLSGTHEYPIDDIFTKEFMSKHFKQSSFIEFLDAHNLSHELESIEESQIDFAVASDSDFDSWNEAYGSAVQKMFKTKLGF